MNRRPIRFTSQWALVGVILFYAVATAMVAWHRQRIVTPTSVGGSECAAGNIEKDGPPMSYSKDEQKTMTELGTEQFSDLSRRLSDTAGGSDTTETPPIQNNGNTSDTVITSTPAIQALTKIRTKAKCVESMLRKAVIEPYHINGQIEGLQITGLDKILIARDLLLKSGDIIRAVNGHPLNSKRRAYEIFKKARKLPTMKIELLRDGKTETLLYYLR